VSTPGEHVPVLTGQTPDYQLNVPDGSYTTPSELERGPNNPSWDVLASLVLWVLSILAVFIVPTLVALPYIMFRYRGVPNAAQSLVTDHTVLLLTVIGVIPAHLLTFLVAWAVVTMRGRRPFWRSLGWSFSPKFGFWTAVGVASVLYVVGWVVATLIGGGQTDIDVLVNSTLPVKLLVAVLATTSGPLVEEIVYRGILYPSLERRIGLAWSVALVSFLFALVHVAQYRNNLGVITVILMLSVSLTLVRAFTGQLLPCFIIHMVFNGIVSVLMFIQPFFEQPDKSAAPKAGILLLWRMMRLLT
jgi:membrane protease YdiL (CAAX protease family)